MTHVHQSANNKFTDDKFDAALNSINAKPIADEEILDAEYEVIEEPNPNDKRKKAAKILSGIAIGAGLVGGTLAYVLKGDKSKTVDQPVATNSETVNSNSNGNETISNNNSAETTTTPETSTGSLEIAAGLDTETLAKTLIEERYTQWANAGVYTKSDANEFYNEWMSYPGTSSDARTEFIAQVASENTNAFTESLFIPGWEQSTNLVSEASIMERLNKSLLDNYMLTAWNSDEHPENKEAYKIWFTVDSVSESNNGGDRVLTINFTEYSNSDMNNIDPITSPQASCVATMRNVNGVEKIASIVWTQETH